MLKEYLSDGIRHLSIPDGGHGGLDRGHRTGHHRLYAFPDADEEILNAGQDARNEGSDAVPDALEEGLDSRPDLAPARAKPAKEGIQQAFQCFQNCGQHTLDAFPDGGEDLLYTSPRLIPVASEDPDEHVEGPECVLYPNVFIRL